MLLYLMYWNKLSKFTLPKDINGNYIVYDYDKFGSKRNLFNIEQKDNIWYLYSNYDNRIINKGKFLENIELNLYMFYQIQLYDGEVIIVYTAPSYDNNFYFKELIRDSMVVGNQNTCDVFYNLPSFGQQQIRFSKKGEKIVMENLNPSNFVYVNNIVQNQCAIDDCCVVFCLGLRIVICGNYFFINNPNNLVLLQVSCFCEAEFSLAAKDYAVTSDIHKDFYEEKDYYAKAPIFRKKLSPLNLTITKPPTKQRENNDSIIMTVVPSALMSISSVLMGYYAIQNFKKGDSNMESVTTSVAMCVTMLISGIMWPFVERKYRTSQLKKEERKRIQVYTTYLGKKEQVLKEAINSQKNILRENNISLEACQQAILNRTSNLFSRNLEREDFLTVRLGTGNAPLLCNLDYTKEDFSTDDDLLLKQIDKIIDENKIVADVPISLSLLEHHILAFVSDTIDKCSYLNAILLQLLTFHSYLDLKIVVLTDEIGGSKLSFLKNLNHCFSNDRQTRFFATNFEEAQTLSVYLEKELNVRKSKGNANDSDKKSILLPYYLIVCNSVVNYRNLMILEDILNDHEKNFGFGILFFDEKVSNIPNECSYFVNYNLKDAAFFNSVMESSNISYFVPEFVTDTISLETCYSALANIPVHFTLDASSTIPSNVGFLEMYQVGKIEQLNIANRWKNSNLSNSLAAPIGVDGFGNILSLDLHEKKHGPHGLVAGMTGSGKSEFIVTYILSLAINYRPDEVQFVLIDYKGGGLAGAFENRKTKVKLPHLVGTITNLDKASMKRSLASIQSELQRRQRMFNEAKDQLGTGTIDIYKYQKYYRDGALKVPLSHLFIICDEFAELKAQQPDFMDQLISTARIGRSLGIHLILATQKPSGVVDEQIWSNSKFKVCCKVQTVEDSKEMIQRDDAAFIKDVGRFFLQVGYDEYFVEGQSAYSGGNYVPTDKIKTKINNDIYAIDNVGEVKKSVELLEEVKADTGSFGIELDNILKYIIEVAQREGYSSSQLWLDNIEPIIYIENIKQKYQNDIQVEKSILNPVIGEYDNPQQQTQGIVTLPITKGGNVCVVGVTGSGKTTLFSTIIYSLIMTHPTEEVNIYVIDLGLENLKRYEKAPQVGEVLTINDDDKITTLFNILSEEVTRRKKLFLEDNSDFISYSQKYGLPNIVVFINGLDVFKEKFDEIYDEKFVPFTRDCNKNGITFVVSGSSTSTIDYRIQNNFPQIISYHLLDSSDYYSLFNQNDLELSNNPGRGLIKIDDDIYEFQTALLFDEEHIDYNLEYIFDSLSKMCRKVAGIPTMPNIVTVNSLRVNQVDLAKVPIGLSTQTVMPSTINLTNKVTRVVAKSLDSLRDFLEACCLVLSKCVNTKIIILNGNTELEVPALDNLKYYDSNFKPLMDYLDQNIPMIDADTTKTERYLVLVYGYKKIQKHLEKLKEEKGEEVKTLDDIITLVVHSNKFSFLCCDDYAGLAAIKNASWYSFVDKYSGIWIGPGLDEQNVIRCKVPYQILSDENSDNGYIVMNSKIEVVRYIQGGILNG